MLVLSHATSLCFLNNLVSHDDDVDDGHDDGDQHDDDGNDDGDNHNVNNLVSAIFIDIMANRSPGEGN